MMEGECWHGCFPLTSREVTFAGVYYVGWGGGAALCCANLHLLSLVKMAVGELMLQPSSQVGFLCTHVVGR